MTKLEILKRDIEEIENEFIDGLKTTDLATFIGNVLKRIEKLQNGQFPMLEQIDPSWEGDGVKLCFNKPCEITRAYPSFPDELPGVSYFVTAVGWYNGAPVQELFTDILVKKGDKSMTIPVGIEALNEYVLFDILDSLEDKVQQLIEIYPSV